MVEWAERTVERQRVKRRRWFFWAASIVLVSLGVLMDIVYAPSCVGTLFTLGYVGLFHYGDWSQRKRLPHMYRETITLQEDEIILRDSDGKEVRRLRYDDIVRLETRSLSPYGPDRGRIGPLEEELRYICLFRQDLLIQNGEQAGEYQKMYDRIILFPYDQSAWDFLCGRIPAKENGHIRVYNRF